MSTIDALVAPMAGADHRDVGGVQLDIVRTGTGRVKRVIYPPGFHWAEHMKGVAGTEVCMHAHVAFLARGHVQITYTDGCTLDFVAPQVMAIEPGHDGRVIGDEAAILIEVDFEGETAQRFGLPPVHRHG